MFAMASTAHYWTLLLHQDNGTHQTNSVLKPASCCSCKQAETERTRNDLDVRNLASNDMLSAADKLGVC